MVIILTMPCGWRRKNVPKKPDGKMYFIMDGRAQYDVDRAIVCEVCHGLDEAEAALPSWPHDHVVVDQDTWQIVLYHPEWFETT